MDYNYKACEAFIDGEYTIAYDSFSEAINKCSDASNGDRARLLSRRAEVCMKLQQLYNASADLKAAYDLCSTGNDDLKKKILFQKGYNFSRISDISLWKIINSLSIPVVFPLILSVLFRH